LLVTYSYKVRRKIALLNADEWLVIQNLGVNYLAALKRYRNANNCTLGAALQAKDIDMPAMAKYKEITGYELKHPHELRVLEMEKYGSLCPNCDLPFRTPAAKMCAECGYKLANGKTAGPLRE
ncbi:MAG: hypothetical protein ACPGRD_08215, partial [Planktomarina sp.]